MFTGTSRLFPDETRPSQQASCKKFPTKESETSDFQNKQLTLRLDFHESTRKRKSMDPKKVENPKEYLSTRQSARQLQVSLGTVQKMVETGELLAWKTRGGHRRILMSSLEQLLKRRRMGLREQCGNQYMLLSILRREEQFEGFQLMTNSWKSSPDLRLCNDTLDALMQAVSLAPDLIYVDWQIPPIEQVHLLHYLYKNIHTRRITVLVDAEFLKLHPQVLKVVPETPSDISMKDLKPINNPMIRPYKRDKLLQDNGSINPVFSQKLENLILDCLAKKCERA
jgi:excisionase family DNA binding protein